jgi:hypothetical protein
MFFLGWTLSGVAVRCCWELDPTEPSLTLPLMMPLLFAGMSYPRASADAARRWCQLCRRALILGLSSPSAGCSCLVLAFTAGMCPWAAHNRAPTRRAERQRDELTRIRPTR